MISASAWNLLVHEVANTIEDLQSKRVTEQLLQEKREKLARRLSYFDRDDTDRHTAALTHTAITVFEGEKAGDAYAQQRGVTQPTTDSLLMASQIVTDIQAALAKTPERGK